MKELESTFGAGREGGGISIDFDVLAIKRTAARAFCISRGIGHAYGASNGGGGAGEGNGNGSFNN